MPTNSQNKFYCVNLLDFLALDNGEEFVNDKISSFSWMWKNKKIIKFLWKKQFCSFRYYKTF